MLSYIPVGQQARRGRVLLFCLFVPTLSGENKCANRCPPHDRELHTALQSMPSGRRLGGMVSLLSCKKSMETFSC